MNPIRTMIAAVVAGSVATGAMAANGDSGVYVGVQGGYQHTAVKTKFTAPNSYTSFDSMAVDGFAGGLYGGVKFNTADNFYVAGELNVGTSRAEAKLKAGDDTDKVKSRASYGAAVLGGFEVAPSTNLYGRLGYQRTKFKASDISNKRYNGFRYGLGLETALSNELALRLDWSRTHYSSKNFRHGDERTKIDPRENLFQVGLAYTF